MGYLKYVFSSKSPTQSGCYCSTDDAAVKMFTLNTFITYTFNALRDKKKVCVQCKCNRTRNTLTTTVISMFQLETNKSKSNK